MKNKVYVMFFILFFIYNPVFFANSDITEKEFIDKYYFDVDLKGSTENAYFFREFPFYNDKGQVSSLGEAFLSVLQDEIWTWTREPRIYVKDNFAYIHAVKLDGLNILYTLKKENNQWYVVKKEEKKLPTVGNEVILERAFLKAIVPEILNATKTYYGDIRAFHSARVIDIVQDEIDDKYDVTIQIVTYEGPVMPPFGFDTITLQIPGFKVIKYEHKNISDIYKIPLESN